MDTGVSGILGRRITSDTLTNLTKTHPYLRIYMTGVDRPRDIKNYENIHIRVAKDEGMNEPGEITEPRNQCVWRM
jgi:hypothetical protein